MKHAILIALRVSWLWAILPIAAILLLAGIYFYRDAGTHLTAYSVHVSGYTTRSGREVRSYYRRPPGSVKHDAPFEVQRFWLGCGIFIVLFITGHSVWAFYERYNHLALRGAGTLKHPQRVLHMIQIDEDNFDLTNITRLLTPHFKRLDTRNFSDPIQALAYMDRSIRKGYPPDVVLADLQSPAMNLYELALALSKLSMRHGTTFPVIALSKPISLTEDSPIKQALSERLLAHSFSKGSAPQRIADKVREVI